MPSVAASSAYQAAGEPGTHIAFQPGRKRLTGTLSLRFGPILRRHLLPLETRQ